MQSQPPAERYVAERKVAVGVDTSMCPRCARGWDEHSDADRKTCISSGIGYVSSYEELDGEVADVKIVVDFEPTAGTPTTLGVPAVMDGTRHPTVTRAAVQDKISVVEGQLSEAHAQRAAALKQLGDLNRRIAEGDGGRLRPPCLPAEMPELRLRMIGQWDTPGWRMVAQASDARTRSIGIRQPTQATDNYTRWEKETLAAADLWWIGTDMCQIVTKAMASIPGEATLDDLPWPSQSGLVVLEHPWFCHDAVTPDSNVVVDAIVWGPATLRTEGDEPVSVLAISVYRLLDFAMGLSQSELELAGATGAVMRGRQTLEGLNSKGQPVMNLTGREWVPLGRSEWPFGARLDAPLDDRLDIDDPQVIAFLESAEEDRRFIAALWALINTKSLATVDERTADRAARRRAQRLGEKEPSSVKVVYLRRPEHQRHEDDDTVTEGRHVEWSHRWMVNPHPRLQPYGPGRKYRKLIMVPPHVKGPDNKPLIIKDTVKAVVR